MLDPKLIRENSQLVKDVISAGRGNPDKANIDRWLELDQQRKSTLQELEELNHQRNELSKVGKQGGNIDEVRAEAQLLKKSIAKLEDTNNSIEREWQEILDWTPNIPLIDMPVGQGEDDNVVIKAWIPRTGYLQEDKLGKAPDTAKSMPKKLIHTEQDFTPKHHLDIGETLGIIDTKQSAKVSGSRFSYLLGDAVLLQYALQQMLFSELLNRGFMPVVPPLLVKYRSLYGTSHFPEGLDQVYKIDSEHVEDNQELYLVGSAEPTNFSYFMDKTLDEDSLPRKVFAMTTCFRSEAGSWGKDTKGIKRVHQFDKIEMNVVCTPEQSSDIFDELLSINEWILQELGLPYHLVLKCTGDAGYLASAKQVDPEVWLSGQQEFMEVATDTNTTDYQARRLNIKYKTKDGSKEYVHTVNDTGIAMGRMIIAIIDNYQQADGTIKVPKALEMYMGKSSIQPNER